MGLFMDPEEMMEGMEENLNDPDLEAELAALTGGKTAARGRVKAKGKERISMYQTALKNAKAAGETSKVRRIERGLKSLQSMLTAVKKGRSVNETDIPPPVATGASRPPPPAPTTSSDSSPLECTAPGEESEPVSPSPAIPEITVVSSPEEEQPSSESAANLSELPTPEESKNSNEQPQDSKTNVNDTMRMMLLERQREYKMGALSAKKQGDKDQAMQFFRISKGFDAVLEALGRGESVDLSNLPPSLKQDITIHILHVCFGVGNTFFPVAASSAPPPPKDALEALEQRKAKYLEASAQAKANGDERKARMHDRIAKQYQNAIRAHKAGKVVNFDELPVPPGFPPIPGQKTPEADQGIVVALEAAHKLASTDVNQTAEEEEEEEGEEQEGEVRQLEKSDNPNVYNISPFPAAEQVQLLENRRKQFLKAALQAKQKNELDQAKTLLRKAKGLEPMIEAARGGRAVDISQIPSPPGDEEDDFIMVHHSDVQISEKSEQIYAQLTKILQEQYEKCMTHSKQFTHLGNVKETTKFEKMAESCKKSLELLKLSHSRGLPPPKHHFEERALHTVGIFPELSSTEMVVMIVKGINLPAPNGIQTNDLDEQPQKHKTSVIKNTNCPEYNQNFTLTINRNHRGFRRLVTSKGLKLELFHKGGFLRSDKPIGTAVVKLEGLENQSEIREIVEVMDGRKHTGGRVDVKVRLREPLSGTELQTSSLKWLVIDQISRSHFKVKVRSVERRVHSQEKCYKSTWH
uniref:C2 domain-containing protein n=1 Tax=Periophthalmus magnuspinnatus TaxID=409849 RepID=A0A3B4A2J0_9GOBI